ncbi:MAG: peptide-methionine (S)-S-oxide reductase MsrA [Bacteroidota bacterium]
MKTLEKATIGGGCFWCVEAVLQRLNGVQQVVSGYAGGKHANPSYREVCSGRSGHAEVVQVTFDPEVLSYRDLLTVFMTTHDPTTLNRQGADQGTQYRSTIMYHNETQRDVAESLLQELGAHFPEPIVTEVVPLKVFFEAEDYHQDYYNNNGTQGYCQVVIDPKVQKLKAQYADKLKPEVA